MEQIKINDRGISETLKWLTYGPKSYAMSYSGYIINGLRFHTKDSEKSTQNNGVSIEAETICRSSVQDTNQIVKDILLWNYKGHNFIGLLHLSSPFIQVSLG